MFERYTEKAKRVLVFARYEAHQVGSAAIEPEHLLLGILREDKALCEMLGINIEEMKTQLLERTPQNQTKNNKIDLPLSASSKKALDSALTESDNFHHRYVEVADLLMGLMADASSLATQVLVESGVTLESSRQAILGVGTTRKDTPHTIQIVVDTRASICLYNAVVLAEGNPISTRNLIAGILVYDPAFKEQLRTMGIDINELLRWAAAPYDEQTSSPQATRPEGAPPISEEKSHPTPGS